MNVGLLGPLVVFDGDADIAIAAPKERAVLEWLALRVGTVVQPSAVMEALWGDEPPKSARKIIQTYVSALRRRLPNEWIETVAGGYRLCVPPDAVDVVRFERLLRAGNEAVEENDPRQAVAALTDALALWRGEPLLDLADQLAGTAERVCLDELRRSGEEQLFEARLQLGEHASLVVDLEAAVAAEPLKERRWAQLMLALYRSGRQADALRAYGRLRDDLGEQLGIEPSPELRALEEAIVLQKPDLDWRPLPPRSEVGVTAKTAGTASPRGRRHNVPTPISAFIGRDDEALHIARLLRDSRLLTLAGVGGAGKTRLAIHVATHLTDDGSDGVWFADLASIADPGLVAQTVADALGYHPHADEITVDGLTQFIGDQRMLLVVDNCEHVIDEASSLVERVLLGAPGSKVLATSREPLGINGEVVWQVQPMTLPSAAEEENRDEIWSCDSVRLFVQRAAAVDPIFDLSDDAVTVGQIVTRLEGLPLAIELAAARVDTLRPPAILSRLQDSFDLLDHGPPRSAPRQRSLEASIDWSYRLLDPYEALVLRRASIFQGAFTIEALQAVASDAVPADSGGLEAVVTCLASKSLLSPLKQPGSARYRLLDSIREFARGRLRDGSAVEEGEVRAAHAGHYLSLAGRARLS